MGETDKCAGEADALIAHRDLKWTWRNEEVLPRALKVEPCRKQKCVHRTHCSLVSWKLPAEGGHVCSTGFGDCFGPS